MNIINSALISSFERKTTAPLEAQYIFPTYDALVEFYEDPENLEWKQNLHRGLIKIVENDSDGKQGLYWVVPNDVVDPETPFKFEKVPTSSGNIVIDNILTGVGLSVDGEYVPDESTTYLKEATSVMNALNILDSAIVNAQLDIDVVDTGIVPLNIEEVPGKTTLSADLNVSNVPFNVLKKENDGLAAKIELVYEGSNLSLIINDVRRDPIPLGIAFSGIASASYNPATEHLTLIFNLAGGGTQTVEIDVRDMIRSWDVKNDGPTDVVNLTKTIELGAEKDQLSADVRLSTEPRNILVKEGNSLYVHGVTSNIHHGNRPLDVYLNKKATVRGFVVGAQNLVDYNPLMGLVDGDYCISFARDKTEKDSLYKYTFDTDSWDKMADWTGGGGSGSGVPEPPGENYYLKSTGSDPDSFDWERALRATDFNPLTENAYSALPRTISPSVLITFLNANYARLDTANTFTAYQTFEGGAGIPEEEPPVKNRVKGDDPEPFVFEPKDFITKEYADEALEELEEQIIENNIGGFEETPDPGEQVTVNLDGEDGQAVENPAELAFDAIVLSYNITTTKRGDECLIGLDVTGDGDVVVLENLAGEVDIPTPQEGELVFDSSNEQYEEILAKIFEGDAGVTFRFYSNSGPQPEMDEITPGDLTITYIRTPEPAAKKVLLYGDIRPGYKEEQLAFKSEVDYVDHKVDTLAQQARDRGTVHNALTSQGDSWRVTTAVVANGGEGYEEEDVLFIPGVNDDINAIITVETVDNSGLILTVEIAKPGDYATDISGTIAVLGGHGIAATLEIISESAPSSVLDDLVGPAINDRALVIADELHGGDSYWWIYADYSGQDHLHWVPLAPNNVNVYTKSEIDTKLLEYARLAVTNVFTAVQDFAAGARYYEESI